MTREEARQEIRRNWRQFYPADRSKKGIVCPICGNGNGSDGDGIRENPKAREKGGLVCFKCGFKGDILDLLQQDTGADYNTALQMAADTLHIVIDPYRPTAAEDFTETPHKAAQAPQSDEKATGGQITAAAAETPQSDAGADEITNYKPYYKECKARLSDPAAQSYLQARGISPETAARRMVGFDPAWVSPTAIKNQRAKGSDWTPPATARLILPVTKNHYIARAIDDAAVNEKWRKMNETGGGSAGLFGWRELEKGHDVIFIVEGPIDCLSVMEAGRAAVALDSANNADKLIKLLEKLQPTGTTFILCLDNDDAGWKAAKTLRAGMDRLNISHIAADICNGRKDPNEALVDDRAAFFAAIQRAEKQTAARPDSMADYIDGLLFAEIEGLKAAGEVKTGFDRLDEKSGGLYPGLYVLAATSSLGKTTFAGCIADNLAAAGRDVLFFSLEQSRLEIVSKSFARILSTVYREPVNSLALRKGYYPEKLKKAAGYYKEHIAGRLSVIEGNFNCNVTYIADYVRRYMKKTGCTPIVFVDYLQILQPAEEMRRASTKEAIDYTVTELKRLSRELNITVFVISSVNRANYLTPIDFEALKESGSIEFTADVIWGLQLLCLQEDIFSKEGKIKDKRERIKSAKAATPRQIQLVCLKNRYGIANFETSFDYYPEQDVFAQAACDDFITSYGATPFDDGGNGQEVTATF